MNMNPAALMKLMGMKSEFEKNHPKFVAFLQHVLSRPMDAGTILEISIQRPGEEKICTNIRVTESDLAMLEEMKNLAK